MVKGVPGYSCGLFENMVRRGDAQKLHSAFLDSPQLFQKAVATGQGTFPNKVIKKIPEHSIRESRRDRYERLECRGKHTVAEVGKLFVSLQVRN